MVQTAHIRRTETLWLVVTKDLFRRRLRSERWVRMRARLGEAHAEELRRPVLVFRVSSLPLRSPAWDPSSGFTHTLQVIGPAPCFPQEFTVAMSSDRSGLGPGLSPHPPFPFLRGKYLDNVATARWIFPAPSRQPVSGPVNQKRGCTGGGTP